MTILVCGDAMIDRYLWADVTRISPEAPVPIATIHRSTAGEFRIEERRGGAANVVENCKALGAEAVGVYGEGQPPIVKIRVVDRTKHQQLLRIDFDSEQMPVQPADLLPHLQPIIIFSDYGKGTLRHIQDLIAVCPASTILVDPKGFEYKRYKGAHLIKPNKHEMRELVGGWHTEEQLTQKAQNLREELGLKGILLTRASEGMTLYTQESTTHIPSTARDVYDVSGAGDTVIAAFAVAVSMGYSWGEATRYATKAAGIVVGRFGTATATKEEVFG